MKVAIIGSREPTDWQYECARFLAVILSELGHRIHTGAADGIDT
jgi:predicted Rossmann fold nucleotide-binding protein DprA/Smf involved in DNA uptake